MKKVLMICPFFPPIGGIAVNRSFNLAKHLPEFGYHPIIATMTLSDIDGFKHSTDHGKDVEIADMEIIRIPSHYPFRLVRITQKLRIYRFVRFLFYPLFWEQEVFWAKNAFRELRSLLDQNDIDLIYTSSSPFSTLILGRRLKELSHLPWVADLRDPYTDGYMYHFPSKIHWLIARLVEKKVLREADQIVVTSPSLRKLYLRKGLAQEDNINTIMNGF